MEFAERKLYPDWLLIIIRGTQFVKLTSFNTAIGDKSVNFQVSYDVSNSCIK